MRRQIILRPLIRNMRWPRLQLFSMLLILVAQANYSYALPQTFSGSAPQIKSYYNRDKGEMSVEVQTTLQERTFEVGVAFPPLSTVSVKESIVMYAGYIYKGRQQTSPPEVATIVFISQSRQFRFGGVTELLSIIDGKRLALGQIRYSSREPGLFEEVGVEKLSIKAPLRAFLNLANARAATLIIGNTELRLGAQHFNVLSAIANCMIGKTVPPGPSSGAESSNCPVQASNLLAFRGYRFGMSAQEVRNLFPGGAPPISEPDNVGRRSMKVEFPDASDPSGATKLSQLEVHFLDDRVFYISASYSIGKEWQNRLSDFANSISNGLGVSVAWNENYNGNARKLFRITCDALSMNLFTDEESEEIKITSQSKRPWTANATLHLVDEIAASRMRERLPKNSQ